MRDYDETTALLLDECIQALLEGEDWHEVALRQPPDVAPLVAIGHWLMQLARQVPPASHHRRWRMWRRVKGSIGKEMERMGLEIRSWRTSPISPRYFNLAAGRLAVAVVPPGKMNPGRGPEVRAYR